MLQPPGGLSDPDVFDDPSGKAPAKILIVHRDTDMIAGLLRRDLAAVRFRIAQRRAENRRVEFVITANEKMIQEAEREAAAQ